MDESDLMMLILAVFILGLLDVALFMTFQLHVVLFFTAALFVSLVYSIRETRKMTHIESGQSEE
jgi:membrane protein implicated in regulation of membrane protease activity